MNGRFLPGASGNPRGRPAGDVSLRLAGRPGGDALLRLVRLVDDRRASWAARVSAARQVIALGYGRARRTIDPAVDLPELDDGVRLAVRLFLERWRLT